MTTIQILAHSIRNALAEARRQLDLPPGYLFRVSGGDDCLYRATRGQYVVEITLEQHAVTTVEHVCSEYLRLPLRTFEQASEDIARRKGHDPRKTN